MKISSAILTLFLTISIAGTAQLDGFQEDIIELLNYNGTKQEYETIFDSTIKKMQDQFALANVPDEFWLKINEGKSKSVDEAISFLSFAYRKHFTRDEINVKIAFYKTKAAHKLVHHLEEISNEENKEIDAFFKSEIGTKVKNIEDKLSNDILNISKEWRKDVFSKTMSDLVRSGHLTN